MVEPVDIMEIAAARLHAAQQSRMAVENMQASPFAIEAGQLVRHRLDKATIDIYSCHRLASDLVAEMNAL